MKVIKTLAGSFWSNFNLVTKIAIIAIFIALAALLWDRYDQVILEKISPKKEDLTDTENKTKETTDQIVGDNLPALEIKKEEDTRAPYQDYGSTKEEFGRVIIEFLQGFPENSPISTETNPVAGSQKKIPKNTQLDIAQNLKENFQYPSALKAFRRLFADFENDQVETIILLMEIGSCYYHQGRFLQALGAYNEARRLSEKFKSEQTICQAALAANHNNLGLLWRAFGDWDRAFRDYEKAIQMDRELGDRHGEAILLNNIGFYYHSWGDYQKALGYYSEALEIFQELQELKPEDPAGIIGEAAIYNNIASIHSLRGESEAALEHLDKSLKIRQQLAEQYPEKTSYKKAIANIFNIYAGYYAQSDPEQTIFYRQKALQIYQEIGDTSGQILIYGQTTAFYEKQKDYPKAIEYMEKVIQLAESEVKVDKIDPSTLEAYNEQLEKLREKMEKPDEKEIDLLNKKK